jgi:glutamine synthetase
MKAADDCWLFKLLLKGIARRHDCAASFMAKPYADQPGTGMHTHFSIQDADGVNIFDSGCARGTEALHHAVAGCLAALPASTLVLAPHGTSYDRLVPESHAPTGIAWGYENRTTAIRIPGGPANARRIEHRVAGGDANPYLMLAVILGAALNGIEDALAPPPPLTGNAYDVDLPQLPATWPAALQRFESDPVAARLLPRELIVNMAMTKRQEMGLAGRLSLPELMDLYLETA